MNAHVQAGAPQGLSEFVVQAEALDVAERHDEAVDALARGVKAGDIESQTRLGKRLLSGDRAPFLPQDGAGFLISAAKAGGAEAPAILAVLSGAGAFMTQSWQDGLSALVLAAERGWEPAQSQLRVLAADRELAGLGLGGSAAPADLWKRLAASVASVCWHVAPHQAVVLHPNPPIRRVPGLISAEICDWLIEHARPRLAPTLVYEPFSAPNVPVEATTNSGATFGLTDATFVHLLVQGRMAAACGLPMPNMEPFFIMRCAPGEAIAHHYDFIDARMPGAEADLARNGQRVITFLVFLNEGYENGEQEFPRAGVTHKGARGDGLFFLNTSPNGVPDSRMVHAGRAPQNGDKWILSQFFRSREYLGPAT